MIKKENRLLTLFSIIVIILAFINVIISCNNFKNSNEPDYLTNEKNEKITVYKITIFNDKNFASDGLIVPENTLVDTNTYIDVFEDNKEYRLKLYLLINYNSQAIFVVKGEEFYE